MKTLATKFAKRREDKNKDKANDVATVSEQRRKSAPVGMPPIDMTAVEAAKMLSSSSSAAARKKNAVRKASLSTAATATAGAHSSNNRQHDGEETSEDTPLSSASSSSSLASGGGGAQASMLSPDSSSSVADSPSSAKSTPGSATPTTLRKKSPLARLSATLAVAASSSSSSRRASRDNDNNNTATASSDEKDETEGCASRREAFVLRAVNVRQPVPSLLNRDKAVRAATARMHRGPSADDGQGFIYLYKIDHDASPLYCKIGCTKRLPEKRISEWPGAVLKRSWPCRRHKFAEYLIHKALDRCRLKRYVVHRVYETTVSKKTKRERKRLISKQFLSYNASGLAVQDATYCDMVRKGKEISRAGCTLEREWFMFSEDVLYDVIQAIVTDINIHWGHEEWEREEMKVRL